MGVFQKIGLALPSIANRLAAAFGNYGPLHEEQRQQQLGMQQQLQNSTLQDQALNRQHLQQQIDNYQTPAQQDARALTNAGALEKQRNALAPPTDVVAPMPEGGMGHYNRSYNAQSGQWETNPTMVNQQLPNPARQAFDAGQQAQETMRASAPPTMPAIGGGPGPATPPSETISQPRQLPALSKPTGSGMIVPDTNSPTGYSKELYDGMGNVISRIPNALPPAAYVPSNTNNIHNIPKQDVNGNWVNVPESTTSSKTPTLPGIPPQARGGAGAPTRPKTPGGPAQATPINGPDGNPLHGPLGADARKNVSQIATTQKLIDQVLPELEARIKQSGGDMNSLWDAGMQRAAWAEYKHGGVIPDNVDPTLAHLLPTIAQLQIVGGLPYLRGTRSYQYIQQIQQHLPDPEKDSPALMVDKIHSLQKTMPILRQSVLESEGVGTNQPSTMPSTGAKWNAKTLRYE